MDGNETVLCTDELTFDRVFEEGRLAWVKICNDMYKGLSKEKVDPPTVAEDTPRIVTIETGKGGRQMHVVSF